MTTRAESIEKRSIFLTELANHGIVTDAARTAGLDRHGLYEAREREPEFAKAWDKAVKLGNEVIHDTVRRRAITGEQTEVMTKDGPENLLRKSDTLLMFLAKSRFPEYRDHQTVDMNATLVDQSQPYRTLLERIRNKQPSGESYNGNGKHEENGSE